MKFFQRDKAKKKSPGDTDAPAEVSPGVAIDAALQETPVAMPEPATEQSAGVFSRLRQGLSRTSDQLAAGVGRLFLGRKEIDAELMEDLESELLLADVGVEATGHALPPSGRLCSTPPEPASSPPDASGVYRNRDRTD